MDWKTVVGRNDIVGGDIETQEGGYVYRGPIKRIWIEDELVHFETEWTARCSQWEPGKWSKWHIDRNFVNTSITPTESVGRIICMIPMMGPLVIFPKGGSKLDPSKVEGLELS